VINTESGKQPVTFAELRAKLDGGDRAIALNALQVALTELGDGARLVWQRPSRELTGVIQPASAFRDHEGRGVPASHLFALARHLCEGEASPAASPMAPSSSKASLRAGFVLFRSCGGVRSRSLRERRGVNSPLDLTPSLTLPTRGEGIRRAQQVSNC